MDIGAKTVEEIRKNHYKAKSIVVSGPMGVYENTEFNYGTKGVLKPSRTEKPSA